MQPRHGSDPACAAAPPDLTPMGNKQPQGWLQDNRCPGRIDGCLLVDQIH
jgi:hypothetical protein